MQRRAGRLRVDRMSAARGVVSWGVRMGRGYQSPGPRAVLPAFARSFFRTNDVASEGGVHAFFGFGASSDQGTVIAGIRVPGFLALPRGPPQDGGEHGGCCGFSPLD